MSTPTDPGRERPATSPLDLRIGTSEREATVARLQAALGEGRLEIAEFDERLAAVYSARTAGDLVPITADLPAPQAGPARAAAAPARERDRERPPAKGSQAWLAWAWRVWAVAVSINLLVWLLVSVSQQDLIYFWPMWVAGPWGALLLVNTVFSRGTR